MIAVSRITPAPHHSVALGTETAIYHADTDFLCSVRSLVFVIKTITRCVCVLHEIELCFSMMFK